MKLYPNPYCHLDHKSRLAGVCPAAERVRPTDVMPKGELVGAKRTVVSHTPPASVTQQSRTDSMFRWAGDAFEVGEDVDGFYLRRLQARELFEVVGPGEVRVYDQTTAAPRKMTLLQALAEARAQAFLAYRAAYLKDPDTTTWADQFPADREVASAMKLPEPAKASEETKAEETEQERFPLVPPSPPAKPTKSQPSPSSEA